MKRDPGSNYEFAEAIAAGSQNAGDVNSASVDHAKGDSATFFINLGDNGTAGTVDAKLQYSDDDSAWTDDPGTAGNDATITQLTTEGSATINVPNPLGRYSRVVVTVGTEACVIAAVSCLGPLRHVAP
jgi:hypothetical protein